MEYKIFSVNYYHKLKRLPLFRSLVIIAISVIAASCGNDVGNKESNELAKIEMENISVKVVDVHENGKVKAQDLYVTISGVKSLKGYEEFYASGKLKIKGRFNTSHQRVGLWESFYEDGKPWSIGSYTNGVEIGEKKVWYSDGSLRYQGEMLSGKPIGTWTFWDENGIESQKIYE